MNNQVRVSGTAFEDTYLKVSSANLISNGGSRDSQRKTLMGVD